MTEYHKVVLILFKIKDLVSEGKCSLEEQREKNIQTLAKLGLLPEDVFQILLELTPQIITEDLQMITTPKKLTVFGNLE